MTNNISFPALGIEFTINRIAFHIFSHPIYWYALIILTGFIAALIFVSATSKKRGIHPDNVFDVAFYGLISGIICARIYYVIFDPDCLDGNILNIFALWDGGLAIYGGIIGAVISTVIYCKKKKLPVLKTFDICCPGLLIGQAIGRFGNFVNAEVYGGETENILGMSINNNPPVHPLFLYEAIWNIVGLIILLIFRDKKKTDGQVFFFYTLWYGIGRLLLEGMRESQYILYLIDGILGISQLVAGICIIMSVFALIYLQKKHNRLSNNLTNNVE